jgi:hypothetical protein
MAACPHDDKHPPDIDPLRHLIGIATDPLLLSFIGIRVGWRSMG